METSHKKTSRNLCLTTILMSMLLLGCSDDDDPLPQPTPPTPPTVTTPTVSSVTPVDAASEVLIGASISATFSEAMDVSTIDEQSFVLSTGDQAIAGAVSLDGTTNTATFVPSTALSSDTSYSVTVTSAATSAAGVALESDFVWSFSTDIALVDTVAPTITSTDPAEGAIATVEANISAQTSEALDPATVNADSFVVSQGDTLVAGVVSTSGTSVSFDPTEDLVANSSYTATLTTEITDLASTPNALANDYVWSFTTELSTPTVILTNPLDAETDVAINHNVVATFSEPMNSSTIDTVSFTLAADSVAVPGSVTLDVASNSAIFQPNSNFSSATMYTATVTTAATSAAGMALASDHSWSFTTVPASDVTAPTVISTDPLSNAVDFPPNRNLVVEFSEALDPASVNSSSFVVTDGLTAVAGSVVYAGTSVTFNPNNNLAAETLYTATLTTAITDLATPANPLANDYVWSFTTAAVAAAGPAPVNLRTAGDFVILTKTGTTNVPTSAITGNLGASPITAAAMDNVFCSEITGTIYGADAAYTGSGDVSCFAGAAADNTLVANAVLDMGTAYNDAAGRSLPDFTELHAGDISGQTLIPGLYKWGTSVLISTDVTLSGGANDVWIFQVSGDITQADGSRIILAGGAQAKNIFWQVGGGTGAVIGTTAHFEGIILAEKAITVNTGATVSGRLLAQTAVTLDQNAVTQPAQ